MYRSGYALYHAQQGPYLRMQARRAQHLVRDGAEHAIAVASLLDDMTPPARRQRHAQARWRESIGRWKPPHTPTHPHQTHVAAMARKKRCRRRRACSAGDTYSLDTHGEVT